MRQPVGHCVVEREDLSRGVKALKEGLFCIVHHGIQSGLQHFSPQQGRDVVAIVQALDIVN